MPLFVLSPASLAHSVLFAGYYTYLSANVVSQRMNTGKTDGGAEQPTSPLGRAIRAHANFAEYTPFTFALLFIAELNGAPTKWVHLAYLTLFVSRVLSGTGLIAPKEKNLGSLRKFGFIGTMVVLAGTGLYNFGLGYEPLKAFFGIH